jgi:hypothetical protein
MRFICKEYIEEVWEPDKVCCGPMNWALHHNNITLKGSTPYLGEQEIASCPFCREIIIKIEEE